jgi:hypothetical protein
MIPLFPKGGLVFSGTNPWSSITVAYDNLFRIFITSTEAVQGTRLYANDLTTAS